MDVVFPRLIVNSHLLHQLLMHARALIKVAVQVHGSVLSSLKIDESSANRKISDSMSATRSLIYIKRKSGPSTDPCGTPDLMKA